MILKLRKATPEDSKTLSHFFEQHNLDGPFQFCVQHPGGFFKPYLSFSDDFRTYVLEDDKNNISGVASFLFREVELEGKIVNVGYSTDLRVKKDRESLLSWTKYYLPILKELEAEKNCELFFSLVPESSGSTYNALVRPRSYRREIPRYHLLRKLDFVIVTGRLPFTNPLNTISIEHADESDLEELCDYLKTKTHDRILSRHWTIEVLKEMISKWPGFAVEDILLARNSQKKIVGCVFAWRTTPYKRYNVSEYDNFGSTFKTVTKLGSFVNITRPFPDEGKAFDFVFLSHVRADNPDIFFELLRTAYAELKPNQHISYFNYFSEPVTLPPKSFVSSTWQMGLYTVIDPKMTLPISLLPNPNGPTPQLDLTFL